MKKEYCEIFNACFPQFRMGPELFSELVQTDKTGFIEQVEGDKIVGFAAVEDQYLRLICVEPGSRAAGIGRKLLAEAEACIKKNGFDKVVVGGSNSRLFIGAVSDSFGFFEKCGYLRTNQYEEMLMKLRDFHWKTASSMATTSRNTAGLTEALRRSGRRLPPWMRAGFLFIKKTRRSLSAGWMARSHAFAWWRRMQGIT
ncbi:MAG: GNAT family N-acetyltransferase [Lachnospiraceae bacterium]|nr:GNAT family N-acetyltransferase [Lachnospiraceae bacterium]